MKQLLTIFTLACLSICGYAQSNIQAVDLGLPSGTLWADRNLGANTISESGDFYMWGETTPRKKKDCDWKHYIYTKSKRASTISKYNNSDGLKELVKSDDTAFTTLGGTWRMPTSKEMQELLDFCILKEKFIGDQHCVELIGPNGNSIIIPMSYENDIVMLWTSSLSMKLFPEQAFAWDIFNSSYHDTPVRPTYRYVAGLIRPVCQGSRTYTYKQPEVSNITYINDNEKLEFDVTIPSDKIKILDGYIYLYSNKSSYYIKVWFNNDPYNHKTEHNALTNGDNFSIINKKIWINKKGQYDSAWDKAFTMESFCPTEWPKSTEPVFCQIGINTGLGEKTFNYNIVGNKIIGIDNKENLPTFTFNSPATANSSTYTLNIGVNSTSAITSTKVLANGVSVASRGANPVQNDGAQFNISEQVALKEGVNTIHVEATNAAGTAKLDKTVTYTKPTPIQIPTIIFYGPLTTNISTYSLNIGVNSTSAITSTKVLVNGVSIASRGVNPVQNDNAQFNINEQTTLKEGANTIHVEVTNAAGTATLDKVVTYTKSSPNPSPTPIVKKTDVTQKCLALVIGNADYQYAKKLVNPTNDAKDVSAKLRALGFTVMEQENTSLGVMDRAINDFVRQSSKYDVAVFYYAGHAIENGVNYLIPVDARLEYRADLRTQCIDAQSVLDKLDEVGSKAKIIVLDACRDNPITRGWTRAIGGGLAQMVAPEGTYIMYSTGPGRTADDGAGRNSPFTNAFLTYLDVPNLSLNDFFINVAKLVRKNTDNMQAPWQSSSFYSDFYFNRK